MRILVTNDDGIYSPGLTALAEVAAEFGEVRIVAPDVEMSAQGHTGVRRSLDSKPTV
jgi:5'-nucleotidase